MTYSYSLVYLFLVKIFKLSGLLPCLRILFVLFFEMSSSEEIGRSHEIIQKLQSVLESERENCGAVSEQRLRLQQENEQLQKETEDLRKVALEAQRQAKLKVLSRPNCVDHT
jgi:hypothetical protein